VTPEGATTVMPAWQPGAAQPATTGAPPLGETMPLPGAQPAAGEVQLLIESGPDSGQKFKMSSSTVRVGRSPDNDLILRDPATSGHHARLERRGSQYFITDLGSTNGTLVNGEPVQEKELKHGDKITVGQNAVKFTIG
jgi:pSer/pThr/pTyr-binding forkhead associated (FHA) protein